MRRTEKEPEEEKDIPLASGRKGAAELEMPYMFKRDAETGSGETRWRTTARWKLSTLGSSRIVGRSRGVEGKEATDLQKSCVANTVGHGVRANTAELVLHCRSAAQKDRDANGTRVRARRSDDETRRTMKNAN